MLLLLAGALPPPAAAQSGEAGSYQDVVSTLPLTDTLTSWGNLGGVTVDRLGMIYVANFRDAVWRIEPDGHATRLAGSLYGASGNAVDAQGRLLQSNFFGNTISRIDREGRVETLVDEGLSGPVGIAVGQDGTLFVCNCTANSIARVAPDGTVSAFASGEQFACPNSIAFGPDGLLYVANFNTDDVLRLTPAGDVSVLATLPAGGNAHLAFARGNIYVTKITTNQVYRVTLDGAVSLVAGTGALGDDDGPAPQATFARPNGIAASHAGDVLYLNTLVGEWNSNEKGRLAVRTIRLASLADAVLAALADGSVEDAEAAYRRFKQERPDDNTLVEAVRLGYRLLSGGQAPAALALFRLNAASYPEQPAAHYNLGEGYRYAGQTEPALAAYERTLALDPDHANAASRIQLLREQ